jgi:imidazolonepropionase-like amidohydrolase
MLGRSSGGRRHGSPDPLHEYPDFRRHRAKPYPGEVRVEGNRIVAVAPAPARLDRAGATLVDGGGAVLMPGMVEAHAHLSWPCAYDRIILDRTIPPEEHLLITARNARITLDHGFTSAYSAGSLGTRFEIALRDEIDGGWLPGPRLKASSIERAPGQVFGIPQTHDVVGPDPIALSLCPSQ